MVLLYQKQYNMDSIANYFESIPSLHRTIILASGLMFFWLVEGILPSIRKSYKKVNHALINMFFTLTTLIVNLAFAFIIVGASDYEKYRNNSNV